MKSNFEQPYLVRESILALLTDDEVAQVSTAETAVHLSDGEEYLDLEHLDQGVRRAPGSTPPMGRVLPRKSVHEATWNKILKQLVSSRAHAKSHRAPAEAGAAAGATGKAIL